MAKTLVVAEKPSVARDLASTLPGSFKQSKDKTHLETQDGSTDNGGYIVTWAVGHLVGLAPPDEYDPKLKKWRFADLPILPEKFKLIPNDERAGKQLRAIHRLMADDEVDLIVNACDAGREGELIFAYVYDLAPVHKPVQRLWLSSMTKTAIREAFEHLRPAEELHSLEEAARSRSEADWLVGHERHARGLDPAARGVRRRGLARTRADAHARAGGAPRGGDPQLRAGAVLARRGALRGHGRAPLRRPLPGRQAAARRRTRRRRSSTRSRGQAGEITKLEKTEQREQPQLLYDLTSLQRHANSLYGFSARRTLAAAQRLYEEHKALTYPRTNSRFLTGDMIAEIKPTAEHVGPQRPVRGGVEVRARPGQAAARPRRQRRQGPGPPRDHPDELRARPLEDGLRRGQGLRPRRQALPRRLPPRGGVRAHAGGDDGAGAGVPDQWPPPRSRPAGGPFTASLRSRTAVTTTPAATSSFRGWSRARASRRARSSGCARRRSRRGASRDASLLGAMETAGKEVEDAELREAMKDSGIGTPATRASIIERLVDVGYIERDGRALVATEKGIQVIRLLGEHQLTSPELTGSWERRLRLIEHGEDTRPAFMDDIKKFTTETVEELDKLKGVQIERAKLGPVPDLRPRDHREPEGLLVLVARGPRLRLRDLEEEGRQEPAGVGREGADRVAAACRESAARTPAWDAPRRPSPASARAPAARSARSSGWSRPTRASGASSSTRTGRRSRPPASPRRSARRRTPEGRRRRRRRRRRRQRTAWRRRQRRRGGGGSGRRAAAGGAAAAGDAGAADADGGEPAEPEAAPAA